MLVKREKTKAIASSKAGMDEKTARKYLSLGRLPSQLRKDHSWRTRKDPFEDKWDMIRDMLMINGGLEAKTLFEFFQRDDPGSFSDGQLRTLQRRIKEWRATEGPGKEVYFPQIHIPGRLSASDFTGMSELGITINGEEFRHLFYHFVLTYSNWETGTICFSESFESLSEGLQNALWELGGVPFRHRTDRLSSAVHKECNPEEFTLSYQALLNHYGLEGEKTGSGKANENGDIEQRHYRFKRAVDQSLLLRGRRDFVSREEYSVFLQKILKQVNAGRIDRFQEELAVLRKLPVSRLHDSRRYRVRVGPSSTVRVLHNTYSVHSRLIGEWVEARVHGDYIDIVYAQRTVERLPRVHGERKHRINYRHIIDWLVKKPGAFENYRYRDDLFPSSHFRMVYDLLSRCYVQNRANREYLEILHLAATEGEEKVETILRALLTQGDTFNADVVKQRVNASESLPAITDIPVTDVNLASYDALLSEEVTYVS